MEEINEMLKTCGINDDDIIEKINNRGGFSSFQYMSMLKDDHIKYLSSLLSKSSKVDNRVNL